MSWAHVRLSNNWNPRSSASSCWTKMLSGNFRKCQQHSLPILHLSRRVGKWRGVMSWESTEPVIMDKHLAPFPPERLQWPQPNHCLLKHWSLLAHTTKSTISPCLPLPPWSARRNMLPSQTLTDEKQIQCRQPHYLTGCKWLGEFKLVIHAPPKPRLGQL